MTVAAQESAFYDILALDLSKCSLEVCLASIPKHEQLPEFKRLLLSNNIKQTFKGIVASALNEYRKYRQQNDLQILDFSPETKPDSHKVETFTATSPEYQSIMTQVAPLAQLQSMASFREEPSFSSGLRFYVITLQLPGGETLYFYRRYTPKKRLSENSNVIVRLFNNQYEYEEVADPGFLFDYNLDCIQRGDTFFLLRKEHFYYMFRYMDTLLETFSQAAARIKARIPMINFDVFERACENDARKKQRLINIARQPYLDTITIGDMRKVISDHKLKILLATFNGQEMLQYDPDDKWALLNLLEDNYLKSLMTDYKYEADGKRGV